MYRSLEFTGTYTPKEPEEEQKQKIILMYLRDNEHNKVLNTIHYFKIHFYELHLPYFHLPYLLSLSIRILCAFLTWKITAKAYDYRHT